MKSWLIFAVALTASIGHAGGLSWNYLDAGAYQAKSSNGGFAEGSLSFSKRWMFQGSYGISKPDGVDGETQGLSAGLGYRFGLTSNTDFLVAGGYTFTRIDLPLFNQELHGGYVTAMIRTRLFNRFEIDASVSGLASDDSDVIDNDIAFRVQGRFYLTPVFSLNIGVQGSDNAPEEIYTFGIRFQGRGFHDPNAQP